MKSKSILGLGSLLVLGFGCATSRGRVVMTEGGALSALGNARDEGVAMIAAVDVANEYCRKIVGAHSNPVYPANAFAGAKSGGEPKLDLSGIPYIGKVFKTERETNLVLNFRCASK